MTEDNQINPTTLRLGLPGGRMEAGVLQLLADAGIVVTPTARGYRPSISLTNTETKTMKPQNLVEALANGSRDLGFAGEDWVVEKNADLVPILDTGLDAVSIVAAAPDQLLADGKLPNIPLRIATEYENLTLRWVEQQALTAVIIKSFGRTEVFPPEDADLIVDNVATGSTLKANGLTTFDVLMTSSTRLYASRQAMEDPEKKIRIEDIQLLLTSVLEARRRVMLEVNAPPDGLDAIVALLPCMREATVSPLFGDAGFAVKAAIPIDQINSVIPRVKAAGGTDIIITRLAQIVP